MDELKKQEDKSESLSIKLDKQEVRCPACLALFDLQTKQILEKGYDDEEEKEPKRYSGRFISEL